MKRKLLMLGILATATVALSACTKDNGGDVESSSQVVESSQEASSEEQSSEASSEVESGEPEKEPEKAPEVDYFEAYASVLDGYYDLIAGDPGDYEALDGQIGVHELCYAFTQEEILDMVGYHIEDLTGDGIPELMIGCMDNETDGREIFAIYTYKDGAPVFVAEGWARNYMQWLGENRFYTYGSGGASYSMWGTYQLTADGTELACEDYYFTHEYNGDYEDIRVYHNTSGEWDVEKSKEEDYDVDEVWRKMEAINNTCVAMKFDSMASYGQQTGKELPVAEANVVEGVYIAWAEDVKSDYSDYEMVSLDAGDQAVEVAISFVNIVQNFKVLNLDFKDVDEDGKLIFDTEEVYSNEELIMPVVIKVNFIGDIPNWGISFEQNGVTKNYAIGISGFDGSLELVEF